MTPGRYNEHEVRTLTAVCRATGQDPGKLSNAFVDSYLKLFYTVPHCDRGEGNRALAILELVARQLQLLMRCEFDELRKADPELGHIIANRLGFLEWEFERLKSKVGGA